MSVFETARSIYGILAGSANAEAHEAALRTEAEALAMKIATNPQAAFDLTSSTVNGQTFSGQPSITNRERLELLNLVLKQFDAGQAFSTRTRAVF